jgi:hypothetical protein
VVRDDILGIPKIKTGAYLKTDTSIELYTWKKKYISRRGSLQSFSLEGDKVKMYPPSAEKGENAAFIRTYFTLTRRK